MAKPSGRRALGRAVLGVAAVASVSCAESDAAEAVDDLDQDGVTVAGGDCDDRNNARYPGAAEILGDGVDQDCNGADAPAPAAEDLDLDGVTTAKGDCNDRNDAMFPGATDIPGDGVDQDCSGADTPATAPEDLDQDGVTVAQGDCDDLNRAIKPGARERSFDAEDSDCDGDELPALGDDRFADALGIIDTNEDGAISFDEFSAACALSAGLDGETRPGVVQTHSSCAGTGACRGMHMHPWNELFVHDCRGVNYCAGWSCVETAEDKGRTGEVAYVEAGCTNCHAGENGAFKIEVPPGQDPATVKAAFLDRTDQRFRAAIAFGLSGISPGEVAYMNMPAHFEKLSLRELDAVIDHVRALPLVAENFAYGDTLVPDPPGGEGGGMP